VCFNDENMDNNRKDCRTKQEWQPAPTDEIVGFLAKLNHDVGNLILFTHQTTAEPAVRELVAEIVRCCALENPELQVANEIPDPNVQGVRDQL